MLDKINKAGPVTVVLIAAFLIAALTGAVLTVVSGLTFSDYLDSMAKFATALGLLAVGRGAAKAGRTARASESHPLAPIEGQTLVGGQETVFAGASGGLSWGSPLAEKGDDDMLPHVDVTDPNILPPDPVQIQHLVPPEHVDPVPSDEHGLLGASASGLSAYHRKVARSAILHALNVSVSHSGEMSYSQGADRWSGIMHNLRAKFGQFPRTSDCSAWGTWILWNALFVIFGMRDIVNGASWNYGYTGTGLRHGKIVVHDYSIQLGDIVYYGPKGSDGEHEAVAIGGGYVLSHGSAGIHKLPIDYRPDRMCVRRYI